MTEKVYLEMSGYEISDWTILKADEAQKVVSQITEEDKNVALLIRDVSGKKSFGEGSYMVKRSFLDKINIGFNESSEEKQETSNVSKPPTIPKPPVSGNGPVIPKPPKKEEVTPVPTNTVIMNGENDNFFDDEIFNQDTANKRIKFLVDHGAIAEGNNVVVFDKSYTPMQVFKLNSLEWEELAAKQKKAWDNINYTVCKREEQTGKMCSIQCLACKTEEEKGISVEEIQNMSREEKARLVASIDKPIEKAIETIDQSFEPEDKKEKPVIEKIDNQLEFPNDSVVKNDAEADEIKETEVKTNPVDFKTDRGFKEIEPEKGAFKEVDEISSEKIEAAAEVDEIAKEQRQAKKDPVETKISTTLADKKPQEKGDFRAGFLERMHFVDSMLDVFKSYSDLAHAIYQIKNTIDSDLKPAKKVKEIISHIENL